MRVLSGAHRLNFLMESILRMRKTLTVPKGPSVCHCVSVKLWSIARFPWQQSIEEDETAPSPYLGQKWCLRVPPSRDKTDRKILH
ncbi:hypothetical protein AVEN_89565-1 [Araneus ventricosus]|uniref:Uncharacterized protein n=1 Tax=Araneus ventricosus TaxID=182803 RepID=A0A4Y2GRI6_ARAVE|nr:hypothetical protein AVEN_89565-1 [Araneus ventricosus]